MRRNETQRTVATCNATPIDLLEWKRLVRNVVLGYPKGTKFTHDRVRVDALESGIGMPSNKNAWGAVMSYLVSCGVIRKTGVYIQSLIRSSHGRVVAEWERL